MRVALLKEYGAAPVASETDEPVAGQGNTLVKVAYGALNPVDLRIATGHFYGGSPALPYVPGSEGVGTVVESGRWPAGSRVRFESATPGAFAELIVADDDSLVPVPDGLSDEVAASLGVPGIAAYLSLVDSAVFEEGDTVVVLGATGMVGRIAAQVAHTLGAGRLVVVGRNEKVLIDVAGIARAQSVVAGGDQSADELAVKIEEAAGGKVDIVIDPLWGIPALASMMVMAAGGRLVNLGESAGADLSIPSALLRSKRLRIVGYTNFSVPRQRQQEALQKLFGYASAGDLQVEYRSFGLADVGQAWQLQKGSPGCKLLVIPSS
ncbi:MAG: quinone oxidoreductase family protein [Acidimicrobiales bacterium]